MDKAYAITHVPRHPQIYILLIFEHINPRLKRDSIHRLQMTSIITRCSNRPSHHGWTGLHITLCLDLAGLTNKFNCTFKSLCVSCRLNASSCHFTVISRPDKHFKFFYIQFLCFLPQLIWASMQSSC